MTRAILVAAALASVSFSPRHAEAFRGSVVRGHLDEQRKRVLGLSVSLVRGVSFERKHPGRQSWLL